MSHVVEIKRLYGEAGSALVEARKLIDAHTGKDMPADVAAQVDTLFGQVEAKQKQAQIYERHDGFESSLTAVDESKRLATSASLETPGSRADSGAEVKAFNTYLHGGRSALTQEQKTALVEGTAGNGGYLTPVVYSDQLTKALYDLSILRAAGARIIPIEAPSVKFPVLSATTAAVLTGESVAYNEAEPTVAQVTATPYKYTRISLASEELVADSMFPLWDVILNPDFAQAFAAAENAAFTTGSGSSQPQGVVTGASSGLVLSNSTGNVTTIASSDTIYDLYHALDYKYRPRASWMMNDAVLKIVRKMKDSQNRYLWEPSLQAGQPDTLLNRPVRTNPSMATAAANAKTVLFGDFSYFWIFDRAGLFVQQLVERYADTGQVGYRAYKRFDSHVMLSAAIVYLQQAAS